MDVATLAIKVENGDVVKATSSLNTMAVAGGKTEAATQRLTRRMALLEIEARQMDATMGHSAFSLTALTTKMAGSEEAAHKLARAFEALTVFAALEFIGEKTIEETEHAQAAMAQLEASVKSTGGSAGRTVEQLDELSVALQKTSTFSDEAVKGAETMLLSFNKIKGDQFDRATASVADLATRMGTDLSDAAIKVGKALQDPEHGLAQLRKSGVSFSDAQIQVIKNLYETGRVAEGQNRILDEMAKRYGGAAAAARDTLGGALKGLHNAWGDLFEVTRGASQGAVVAINAITHALETSGVRMNSILKDATVDWETMRASIEKVRAIMSLQIDSKFFQNARNIIERIDFDLNAKIAALNAPAKTGPGGGGTGDDEEASKRAQKFRETVEALDLEIARQTALNGVIGASSATIALLNNAYDARAQRAKNAIDHTDAETAALDARTTAMQQAKDAAVLLAAAEANQKQVRDAQRGDSDAIRDARQALELAGLSDEAAAQRRVDMQAENDLAAARLRFAMMTKDLDKERADVAAGILQREQDIYASTARRVEAVRQIGHETAAVTAEMDKQKKAEDEAQRDMEHRAKELHRTISSTIEGILTDIDNHRNPFVALFDNLKRGAIKAMSDILASKVEGKVGEFLGIKMPADKQVTAAMSMNEAADKMLRAAGQMNGGTSGLTSTEPSTVAKDGSVALPQYLQKFLKVGGAAYGGYQIGYGIGQSTQSQAGGALAGAYSGAAMGAAVGGPWGALAGGVAGLVGGLAGARDAARAAAEALEQMQTAARDAAADYHLSATGDARDAALAQAAKGFSDTMAKIAAAFPKANLTPYGTYTPATPLSGDELVKQAVDDYLALVKQINEGFVRAAARAQEDWQARLDAATPGNERAEAIAANNRKLDRELEDLKVSFGATIDANEANTYAIAQQAVAAEKAAYALNGLTTSVRNAPSGFKLEGYIQEFARAMPRPGQWQPPINPFVPPMSPLSPGVPQLSRGASTGTAGRAPVQFNFHANAIQINGTDLNKDEIADAFLTKLDDTVNATGGLNTTRAAALEVM